MEACVLGGALSIVAEPGLVEQVLGASAWCLRPFGGLLRRDYATLTPNPKPYLNPKPYAFPATTAWSPSPSIAEAVVQSSLSVKNTGATLLQCQLQQLCHTKKVCLSLIHSSATNITIQGSHMRVASILLCAGPGNALPRPADAATACTHASSIQRS